MRQSAAVLLCSVVTLLSSVSSGVVRGQEPAGRQPVYDQIKTFALTGGSADVANLVLKRDRVEMTFTGAFHFTAPVEGRVTGAVFVGQGTMRVEVPPSDFEKENVRRLLGADAVESDFRTAVLRMSDDTFDAISQNRRPADAAPVAAQRLAAEFEPRLTRETGINLSARLAASILNAETPGVFFAQFDGGKRGRFSVVLDHQNRIPVSGFAINGGEKGLVFAYQSAIYTNEVWLAFYADADYARRMAVYSDANDLVDVTHYVIAADLRDVTSKIGLTVRIDLHARPEGVRAIPFDIGETLGSYQDARWKNQLRVKAARLAGQSVSAVQEDWEGGFTVFLPNALRAGEKHSLDVELEGDFMRGGEIIPECFYPRSNTSWFPRHGYLDRATFDLTFRHAKRHKVASVGLRVSEQADETQRDLIVTKYRMDQPVAFATFAIGPFQRHNQTVVWEQGGPSIPLEFNAAARSVLSIKEDFVLAELDNSVRYFAAVFGRYPYPAFGAAFHPYPFGQGFPTLLMLPPVDSGTKETYAFISHETAHQWWGNIVAWRSYRDQWLSEGFAEYSGILYAGLRDKTNPRAASELIREARQSLLESPRTSVGVARGRLVDIGPIILGLRLNSSKSYGAYQALIYNKGALVLRMLHFLLSNPTTGDDKPFLAMMGAFVERHRNGVASTDDFAKVASEHFARSPIAQKYGVSSLDWFFGQWVRRPELPSYTLEYGLKAQPDGSVMISGTVLQENVPDGWFMPLPIVFSFSGNQQARTTIRALGPSTPFELKLPSKPTKVELDPASWILSEKTTTRAR